MSHLKAEQYVIYGPDDCREFYPEKHFEERQCRASKQQTRKEEDFVNG